MKTLRVSSPGRICLFGEHQDYLHLPVIPAAISLRLSIEGRQTVGDTITLNLPDIQSRDSIALNEALTYRQKRDYFRSGLAVLRRAGLTFSTGLDCAVRSEIPIAAGTSSSSALVVAWISFLSRMSDQQQELSAEQIARYAYEAEVLEFHEPGGMMDQYCSAMGGVLHLTFHPALQVERMSFETNGWQGRPPHKSDFVLGDSCQPKDTMAILKRVKEGVIDITRELAARFPDFSLQTTSLEHVNRYSAALSADQSELLRGTLRNRNITVEGRRLLKQDELDAHRFGALLNEHQAVLRDVLQISTPKIDRMLDAALNAGAYGGKINGSGGGGCMFAFAPEKPEAVAEAIRRAGGQPYLVRIDTGVKFEE